MRQSIAPGNIAFAHDISMTTTRTAPTRWQQIAATLASDIEAEGLAPGARLPTEAQLATRFGVNRHTIRRALETLVRRGLVHVEQGRGAFVAEDVLDYEVVTRTRFSEWIRRQNKVPEGQVLRLHEFACRGAVADGLRLDAGSPVALLERLGLADGQPVSLSDHYFAVERLPGITEALRFATGITAAFAQIGVNDYFRQSTRVAARMPTAAEADLLQISRTRPLLVCENVNVNDVGAVIEYGITRYPSNRVQVVFEP